MTKLKKIWHGYWIAVKWMYFIIGLGTVMRTILKHPDWDNLKLWRKLLSKAWKSIEAYIDHAKELLSLF